MSRSTHVATGRAARAARQEVAQENQADRQERSNEEQVAVLDQRLGEGQGARRERARLQGGG